ncbi:hypothetical protein [Algoriphagus boritolerans]|uniref:hypothetical protein n=1 Tax=Algoriphagus boritolerans TaxID=308111 RepID=UPI000B2DD08B
MLFNLTNQQNMGIHELFENQTLETPSNIALIFEGQELTYSELNGQANQWPYT